MKIFNYLIVAACMAWAHSSFSAPASDQETSDDSGQVLVEFAEPRPVNSYEEYKPHLGLQLGVSSPEGSYEAAGNWALEAGFQPYIPFAIGLELSNKDYESTDGGETISRTSALIRGTYNFSGAGFLRYSYVGAATGPVWEQGNVYLGVSPLVGFDAPIASTALEQITLGAQVRYALVSSDGPDAAEFNAVAKYWF